MEHSFILRPGKWEISGSTIDVASNPNIAVGYAVVTHEGNRWVIEEHINEVGTHYDIPTVLPAANAAAFKGTSGIAGAFRGTFAFFDDQILAAWHSDDGKYVTVASYRMLSEERYESRGALFLDGGHVSSWSYVLQRASSAVT
jgi:hypothetical protein